MGHKNMNIKLYIFNKGKVGIMMVTMAIQSNIRNDVHIGIIEK